MTYLEMCVRIMEAAFAVLVLYASGYITEAFLLLGHFV